MGVIIVNILERIIKENAGLIWKIAKKFYGVNKDDLYQAGVLGIIKAYQNYQKDGNTKFSTYAYKYIYGEMYLVACNKEMKYGKDLLQLVSKIEACKNKLAQELMYEPSLEEVAKYLDLPQDKIEMAYKSVGSIIYLDSSSDDDRNLYETIGDSNGLNEDDRIMISDSINALEDLEKDIINARYFEDLTQSETAERLGITQVMVSRYETRSLKKMRDYMYM